MSHTLCRHGIHLYGFVGPGWILDRKEIIGEAVKWLYSAEMVVDLGGPWNTPLWCPWARVDLGKKGNFGEPVKY